MNVRYFVLAVFFEKSCASLSPKWRILADAFEFVAFSSEGKMMRFKDLHLTSKLTSLTVLEVMSFLLIYFGYAYKECFKQNRLCPNSLL